MEGKIWQIIHPNFWEINGDIAYCCFLNGDFEEMYCPFNKNHSLGLICHNLEIGLYGTNIAHFIPMADHGFDVVSEKFLEKIKFMNFSGFYLEPVVVKEKQFNYFIPELHQFVISGKGGTNHRFKSKGQEKCLFCGYSPMICPGCGQINDPCFFCKKRTIFNEQNDFSEEKYFFNGFPKKPIVEGKEWDGSDFFEVLGFGGGTYASTNLKDFFQKNRINEIEFRPAFLNIEGMKKKDTR